MIIVGVMAVDPNGVIGINSGLLWHYPSELEHFCQMTNKQVIVMGRKTFETIPQSILKERVSIIFSRKKLSSYFNRDIKCTIVSSVQEFLSIQNRCNYSKIFMIGGAQIAHLFLENDLISEFIITKIHKPYKGDIYFNLALINKWSKTILTKTQDYTIYRLVNMHLAKTTCYKKDNILISSTGIDEIKPKC